MRVHVVAHNYSVQCHVPEKKTTMQLSSYTCLG